MQSRCLILESVKGNQYVTHVQKGQILQLRYTSGNLSRVEDMESMFCKATTFDQDIPSWNVSKATGYVIHVQKCRIIQSQYFKNAEALLKMPNYSIKTFHLGMYPM